MSDSYGWLYAVWANIWQYLGLHETVDVQMMIYKMLSETSWSADHFMFMAHPSMSLHGSIIAAEVALG